MIHTHIYIYIYSAINSTNSTSSKAMFPLQVLCRPITAVAFYWRTERDRFLASWQPRMARYPGNLHLVLLEDPGADHKGPDLKRSDNG